MKYHYKLSDKFFITIDDNDIINEDDNIRTSSFGFQVFLFCVGFFTSIAMIGFLNVL
jgi:hypothetical protein